MSIRTDEGDAREASPKDEAASRLSFEWQLAEPLELLQLTMLLNHPNTVSVAKESCTNRLSYAHRANGWS